MKQRSRVSWLRAGEANTRFFHLKANGRRRKNFMHALHHAGGTATEQQHKQQLIHSHFSALFSAADEARMELNWAELGLPVADLAELDAAFSEEEIHASLLEMPSDKALGPDGFNALFFKACWGIIKSDVRLAFQQLHNANRSSLSCVNSSHIVLIPKNDNPASLADYRPISLMHGLAKLFMKVLAVRLAKRIAELVGEGQSTFIRGRSIQDNFILGWDDAKQTVDAPKELWDEHLQRCNNPEKGIKCNHIKYKKRRPKHLDDLHVLFEKIHVTWATPSYPGDISSDECSDDDVTEVTVLR
ncbi:hypothetical protein ACQ4PT_021294 [Festuca glaucescens]